MFSLFLKVDGKKWQRVDVLSGWQTWARLCFCLQNEIPVFIESNMGISIETDEYGNVWLWNPATR